MDWGIAIMSGKIGKYLLPLMLFVTGILLLTVLDINNHFSSGAFFYSTLFIFISIMSFVVLLLVHRLHKTEKMLEYSRRQYCDIIENSYNVIYTYDKNGILTFVSKSTIKQTGYAPEDFLDTFCLDWVHPDDREEKQYILDSIYKGPLSCRCRLLLPSGKVTNLGIYNSPIFDENGIFQGGTGIAINIDKDMELEEKLIASEKKYRSLYDTAQVGLITCSMADGKVIMANNKLAELFHYDSASEMKGLPSDCLWADSEEGKKLSNLLKIKQVVANFPVQGICKDRTIKHFEMFSRYNAEIDCIESNLIDVSDKILAEKKLEYQVHILENIQESIIVLNLGGEIVYLNNQARKILSINKTNISCDELLLDILNFDQEKISAIYHQIKEGQSCQEEHTLRLNGEERVFMHRINPFTENKETNSIIIISTDITELVKSRQEAQTAHMTQTQFLANMSHEMRTPMIGILGAVDLLQESSLNNEQSANLEIIRSCGEHLLGWINQILNVSKIEVGLIKLNPESCNLKELLNHCISIIEAGSKDKGLIINKDIDLQITEAVLLDQAKFTQVISSILFNALKFTTQGEINVKAYTEKDFAEKYWLRVSVSDTGIGIPATQVDRVFEPFSQVDCSNSREYGGTGLGLFFSKKVIDLMNGEITLDSVEGYGTNVSFRIPLELAPESNLSLNERQIEPDYSANMALELNPVRILVVEDNQLNQKIVTQMLVNYDFIVTAVSNGLECLRILQEKVFDLILMDMQMPVMDGYETTAFLCKDPDFQDIPIIAMTAHAMSEDRDKCLACGCTSYIAKPFRGEELAQEIFKHINKRIDSVDDAEQSSSRLITELIPEFLDLLEELLEQLQIAIETKDKQAIQSISHDIKGTAGMYGFMEISRIATLLEQAARGKSQHSIKSLALHLYSASTNINSHVG